MSELPWFPFYVDRFLGSRAVRRMGADEVGAYLLLMIEQWKDGPVPDDDEELEFIGRADASTVRRVLDACFDLTDDGWVNETVEEVRAEQQAKSDRRRKAGRKGGRAPRKKKGAQRLTERSNAQAMLKQCSSNIEAEEKIREDKKRGERESVRRPFDDLWERYGSGNLVPAVTAYANAVPELVTHDDLMTAREAYVRRQTEKGWSVGSLAKWIDERGWADPSLKSVRPKSGEVVRHENGLRIVQ